MNLINEFEQYLVENGIAPKTIESYVGDVKLSPYNCVKMESLKNKRAISKTLG